MAGLESEDAIVSGAGELDHIASAKGGTADNLSFWIGNGFLVARYFLMTRTRYAVKPVGAGGSDESRRRQSLKSRTVPGPRVFSLSQTAVRRTALVPEGLGGRQAPRRRPRARGPPVGAGA